MGKEIVVCDRLDCQGHQRSGKEESDGIFDRKRELFIRGMLMFLKMSKVMQSPPHNKLIEQDNKSQEKKDKEYSKVVLSLVLKTLSGAALDSLE